MAFAQDVRVDASGHFISQLDNPRTLPQFDVSISGSQEALRGEQNGVEFSDQYHYEIEAWTAVTGDDRYSFDFANGERVYNVIRTDGHYFSGDIVPYEMDGLYLGHSPTTISWDKNAWTGSGGLRTDIPGEQVWRVENDTIIIPVSVIAAYPEGGSPFIDLAEAQRLIDGLPGYVGERTSDLGEVDTYLVRLIGEPEIVDNIRKVRSLYAPDDIFAQCGIQFRLESYVAVEVPDQVYNNDVAVVQPSPGQSCLVELDPTAPDSDLAANGYSCVVPFSGFVNCGSWAATDDRSNGLKVIREMVKPIARTNLVTGNEEVGNLPGIDLVFLGNFASGTIGDDCSDGKNQPGMSDGSSYAAVAVNEISSWPTTLAHEMGHVLMGGSDHSLSPSGFTDLMAAGGSGTHIPGCEAWGHSFPGTPYSCNVSAPLVTGEQNQCLAMRDRSGLIDVSGGSPLDLRPMLVKGWTYGRGTSGVEVQFDTSNMTEGGESVVVPNGYTEIVSPSFGTAELPEVGDKLALDLFIPSEVTNEYWVGALALTVDIPSGGIYNQWLAQVELTNLTRGDWNTVEFALPSNVVAALRSDLPGVQVILTANTSTSGILVDNLTMAGDVQPQTVVHIEGSPPLDVALLPHGGFEDLASWNSSVPLSLETQSVIDGSGAISLEPNGYTVLTSDTFSASDVEGLSNQLSLDLYLSDPQPNPWWVGDVQLYASCPSAGVYDHWIGYESLTNLFLEEFNQLEFTVPSQVIQAWSGSAPDCTVSVAINVNQGAGKIIIDRLGFL